MTHKPFQELRDKIKDHDEIWLEPRPIPPAPQDDRTWCQNNEYEDGYYGRKPTRYIRADICDDLNNQLLERQISDCKKIIELESKLEAAERRFDEIDDDWNERFREQSEHWHTRTKTIRLQLDKMMELNAERISLNPPTIILNRRKS